MSGSWLTVLCVYIHTQYMHKHKQIQRQTNTHTAILFLIVWIIFECAYIHTCVYAYAQGSSCSPRLAHWYVYMNIQTYTCTCVLAHRVSPALLVQFAVVCVYIQKYINYTFVWNMNVRVFLGILPVHHPVCMYVCMYVYKYTHRANVSIHSHCRMYLRAHMLKPLHGPSYVVLLQQVQ
jgi:hypothetical protein